MFCLPSILALSERQPEDDIEQLFHQLPQIEPPGELLARILAQVRSLPGPLWSEDWQEIPHGASMDALIVRNEKRDPS